MMNDNLNTQLGSMECPDDIESFNNSEYGSDSPRALRKAEVKNRRRLSDLLENKKLRQELDDYDEYLENTYHDDDIISHYYRYESEE